MSDGGKIRIGFVGVGGMGQAAHLRNFSMVPECEVTALADIKQDMAHKVAARWAVPRVYASHDEMLAAEELDAIVASQPFNRHGVLLPDLFKVGVPVFIEKPIAASVETGERIVRSARQAGTWLMVGYHKRSDPATMLAKAEVDRLRQTGELGALKYIRILMPAGDWVAEGFNQNIHSDEPVPELACDPPAADMDADTYAAYTGFVNYYIHQVNLMRHLLGESWAARYADKAGVLLVGESDSGVTCSIEMTPYATTLDWQESALICFEKGWIKLELPAPLAFTRPGQVTIFRDPGNGVQPRTEIPQLPWVHAMWQQARNFVAAVRGDMPTLCSGETALEDLRLARDYIRLRGFRA